MECEKCGGELFVERSRNIVEGDDSAQTRTRVYCVLDLRCGNPQCGAEKQVKNELEIGPKAGA